MNYTLDSITITDESLRKEYDSFIEEQIDKFQLKIQKKKIDYSVVEGLKKVIERFPKVPEFKIFLATAYDKMNKKEQYDSVLKKIREEHPDSLFGKAYSAIVFMEQDRLDLAKAVFNDSDCISDFFPGRKVFEVEEVIMFYTVLAKIKMMESNWGDAMAIINMLENEIEGIDDFTQELRTDYLIERHAESMRYDDDEDEDDAFFADFTSGKEPVIIKQTVETTKTSLPDFNNIEVYDLYEEHQILSDQVMQKLLACDRETLINDMVTVLEDTEERLTYFYDNEVSDEYLLFFNALLILKELKAEEALDAVLERFRNDGEYYEFWAEHALQYLWMVIFELGKNKIQVLADFLKEPGVFSWFKNPVAEALCQIYLHYPEKRLEISTIWQDLLRFFVNAEDKDNVIGTIFISSLIGDIIDATNLRYLPLIKELFDLDRIDPILYGDYEDFLEEYEDPKTEKILSVKEIRTKRYRI